jgi:hypothetical protein
MKVRTTEKLVLHTGTGTVVVWVHANRYSKGQGRAGQGRAGQGRAGDGENDFFATASQQNESQRTTTNFFLTKFKKDNTHLSRGDRHSIS